MTTKILLPFVFTLASTFQALGQEKERHRPFSVELNPLAYAFSGWSLSGTYQPAQLKKWIFNAGAYGFELPSVFVEQIPGNEDEAFALEIQAAGTIGVDFHPWQEDRSGLGFGVSGVVAQFDVTHADEAGQASYTSFYAVPRISYTWFIFKGLYLMPWAGLEIHQKIDGSTQVGTKDFNPMATQFSPNLTVGWAF